MTAPIADHPDNQLITRRSIFMGAAASLICAPAIVRVMNLMPVRRIILASDLHHYGFCDRLAASMDLSIIFLKKKNAGWSANEIAVEMNERRSSRNWPNQPSPPTTPIGMRDVCLV